MWQERFPNKLPAPSPLPPLNSCLLFSPSLLKLHRFMSRFCSVYAELICHDSSTWQYYRLLYSNIVATAAAPPAAVERLQHQQKCTRNFVACKVAAGGHQRRFSNEMQSQSCQETHQYHKRNTKIGLECAGGGGRKRGGRGGGSSACLC